MYPIIIESVLYVALIATAGALVVWGVWHVTPFGRVTRQTRNRRRIDRAAELTCPIHGVQAEEALVRIPGGESVCPRCYQETVHGQLD